VSYALKDGNIASPKDSILLIECYHN